MKKICTILLSVTLFCTFFTLPVSAVAYAEVASEAAVVMDAETGQVLYAKNMERQLYPASTTKIMTALLTVEYADVSALTTVSASAMDIDEPNSANVGLKVGERITVESLLYGMMLRSANEAANTLAEHVGGTQEEFARMMTEKAQEIGAVNTRFANAHGLHEPDHYTTAYDLALITRYAAQNEEFSKYYSAVNYKMAATNENPERTIENHLAMLFDVSPYYNETVVGGKIGFTDEAMHTMSTVATRDGRTLVCVVLKAPTSREKYTDTTMLLDYCFDNFTAYTVPGDSFSQFAVPISNKEEDVILGNAYLEYEDDVTVYLPNGVEPSAVQIAYDIPSKFESEIDVGGFVQFSFSGDAPVGTPPVVLSVPMEREVFMDAVPTSTAVSEKESFDFLAFIKKAVPFLAGAVAVLVVLFLITIGIRHRNLKKHRRKRQERLERRRRQTMDSSGSGGTAPKYSLEGYQYQERIRPSASSNYTSMRNRTYRK